MVQRQLAAGLDLPCTEECPQIATLDQPGLSAGICLQTGVLDPANDGLLVASKKASTISVELSLRLTRISSTSFVNSSMMFDQLVSIDSHL